MSPSDCIMATFSDLFDNSVFYFVWIHQTCMLYESIICRSLEAWPMVSVHSLTRHVLMDGNYKFLAMDHVS